jgi:hypothetical protein
MCDIRSVLFSETVVAPVLKCIARKWLVETNRTEDTSLCVSVICKM